MLTTRKLSDGFGLAIEGVDLSQPLDDDEFRAVEQAFFDAQVLAIKGQTLEPAAFLAFAKRFGPPQPHVIDQFHYPDFPDILILSNGKENGKPIGLADGGSYFHTDYSYLAVPARVTILHSVVVPKQGGNTLFANMYAAYDDLPEATKARIDDLVGAAPLRQPRQSRRDDAHRRIAADRGPEGQSRLGRHRLVRTHPGTGRKALYAVSGSSFEIEGMPRDEGVALLDELKAHALQDRYIHSYAYDVGDVVLWDDLATLHSATLTDPNDLRTLWRITVIEES